MNTITSNDIQHLPEAVFMAYCSIKEQKELTNPFLDFELISQTRNKKRINEHISSRALLMSMLEAKKMDASAFEVLKTKDGKPYANYNGEQFFLSFSHTDKWVLCAFSNILDLGIDAEKTNRTFRPELLNRIASEEEIDALKKCQPIEIWTMKEAVVKSLGIGIRRDLREILIEEENIGYSFTGSEKKLNIITGIVHDHQISVAWSK